MRKETDFCKLLLEWYRKEARVLPWRSNPLPYWVWISEMMLQQTRVDTVIPYFLRFVEELPSIEALAKVEEDQLLKLWQGLGYYSRALNLKKAAIQIVSEHHGCLPTDSKELQRLPGIGPYSAGAISSIAFQQRQTLMDGNVLRVMARILGITEDLRTKEAQRQIREYLEKHLSLTRPGDFNQALMELGATRCLPNGAPLCDRCPVSDFCTAKRLGQIDIIPLKVQKAPREIQELTVLLLHWKQLYGIKKRESSGLLAKMWVLPMIPSKLSMTELQSMLEQEGYRVCEISSLTPAKHIFTHIEWHMTGYLVELEAIPMMDDLTWEKATTIDRQYAIPKAMSYFTKHMIR